MRSHYYTYVRTPLSYARLCNHTNKGIGIHYEFHGLLIFCGILISWISRIFVKPRKLNSAKFKSLQKLVTAKIYALVILGALGTAHPISRLLARDPNHFSSFLKLLTYRFIFVCVYDSWLPLWSKNKTGRPLGHDNLWHRASTEGLPKRLHLPNCPHIASVNPWHMLFRHLPKMTQYSVGVIIMKLHRLDQDSNPDRCDENQTF